jgi:hypothetical protein
MEATLDREDLIHMIKGSSPSYYAMSVQPIKSLVDYSDQYGRYYWHGLENFNEKQLWGIYQVCKTVKDNHIYNER